MNSKRSLNNIETTTDEDLKRKKKKIEDEKHLDKITEIINKNFNDEILYKQFEIEKINEV
jgi:hypothetical protein